MPVPIGQEMAEVAQGISQELVACRGCQVNACSYWSRDGGSCPRDQQGTGHTSWMPGKCRFLFVKRWRKLPKGISKELVTRRRCQVNACSYGSRDGGSCPRDQPGTGHTSWMPGKCLFLLVKRLRKLPKGSVRSDMVTSSMSGESVRPIGRPRCRVNACILLVRR